MWLAGCLAPPLVSICSSLLAYHKCSGDLSNTHPTLPRSPAK